MFGAIFRSKREKECLAETLKSFLRILARLDFEAQDNCFKAIVETLRSASPFGFIHVVERLEEGKSTSHDLEDGIPLII